MYWHPVKIKYNEFGEKTTETINAIDLSITAKEAKKYNGKKVKVSGEIVLGMTSSYVTTFGLFDVKYK